MPRQARPFLHRGRLPVEVTLGDTIAITYEGEPRLALVQASLPWDIRGRDLDKRAVRAFRFDRIESVSVTPPAA